MNVTTNFHEEFCHVRFEDGLVITVVDATLNVKAVRGKLQIQTAIKDGHERLVVLKKYERMMLLWEIEFPKGSKTISICTVFCSNMYNFFQMISLFDSEVGNFKKVWKNTKTYPIIPTVIFYENEKLLLTAIWRLMQWSLRCLSILAKGSFEATRSTGSTFLTSLTRDSGRVSRVIPSLSDTLARPLQKVKTKFKKGFIQKNLLKMFIRPRRCSRVRDKRQKSSYFDKRCWMRLLTLLSKT